MIEAELKAHLRDPARIRAALDEKAAGQEATYRDVYYDRPDRSLSAAGYEVRLRTVETMTERRHLLTYKEPARDAASQSKPEHETSVEDPDAVAAMLTGLGLRELVALTKHCVNYALRVDGRQLLATMVTVPELGGTFLEVETLATAEADMQAALATVRAVLDRLAIPDDDLTTSTYTEGVLRARGL